MKAKIQLSAFLLLLTFFKATLGQTVTPAITPQEQFMYSGSCMKCLLANSTFVYCSAYSKCFDRPASGCGTAFNDLLQSFVCGKDLTQNTNTPVLVATEAVRKSKCVDDTCIKAKGTTYTLNIPSDGRYTLYL